MALRDSYAPGTPNWVDLGSPDPAASAAFYEGLLGWSCEEGPPEAGGYRICLLRGRPVAGIGPSMGPPPERPWWTTYMSVSAADESAAAVEANGGTVTVAPFDVLTFGRMAVCADPEGAPFSVWQPMDHIGAGLVNEPGALTWNELTTRDPVRATAFYEAVFGWTFAENDRPGGEMYTTFRVDGRDVGGVTTGDAPDRWLVYFAVEDVDASSLRVKELGGTVSVPAYEVGGVGRVAVVHDPHGTELSLLQPASTG